MTTAKPKAEFSESGFVIPAFGRVTGRNAVRSSDANDLVRALNALGKIKIVRTGEKDRVVYSQSNIVIELKESESADSTAQAVAYFPFKIYVFPSGDRATPDPSTDWRKFRVRQGVILTDTAEITPTGCDGGAYPDTDDILEADMTDITVAANIAEYWFWLEVDYGGNTATLEHGATPPASWGLTVIPIGFVDTDTNAATGEALIRQFTRTDLFIPCPP